MAIPFKAAAFLIFQSYLKVRVLNHSLLALKEYYGCYRQHPAPFVQWQLRSIPRCRSSTKLLDHPRASLKHPMHSAYLKSEVTSSLRSPAGLQRHPDFEKSPGYVLSSDSQLLVERVLPRQRTLHDLDERAFATGPDELQTH